MSVETEAVRLAKFGWPARMIAAELNIPVDRVHTYLEGPRTSGDVGKLPTGYCQDGSIPLTIYGGQLRSCQDLSKVLGMSPREVAELALEAALASPYFLTSFAAVRGDSPAAQVGLTQGDF